MSVTKHPDYSLFDDMRTEDLEEILRMDSYDAYGAENDKYDTDTILYIMEVVAKRKWKSGSPEAQARVNEKLKEFKEVYLPDQDGTSLYQFDDDDDCEDEAQPKVPVKQVRKPVRHLFSRVGLVAAVIVVIFGLMITAQAAGLDIFGAIARWTDETFHFSVSGEVQSADWANPFYEELSEAGLDSSFIPTYLPDGYSPGELLVSETDSYRQIYLPLNNSYGQYIDIMVTIYSDPTVMEETLIEKDGSPVQEYIEGDRHTYVFENLGVVNVICQINNIMCSISGSEDVSQDMIFNILNSIEVTV